MSENQGLLPLNEMLPKLLTWEDHVAALNKLQEVDGVVNWYRADVLLSAIDRFGIESLSQLSQVISMPISTLTGLVRTARGFPSDKRDYNVPFYVHQQASFIDSFDEHTKTFATDNRFALLKKIGEETLSYREVARIVRAEKERQALLASGEDEIRCAYCGKIKGDLEDYTVFPMAAAYLGWNFKMHVSCYDDLINSFRQKWERHGK